jgi:hypothetical protein
METISRRRLLGGIGIGAAALAVGAPQTAGALLRAKTPTPPLPAVAPDSGAFTLFSQPDLNFQTLFALGAAGETAEPGEVLAVVAAANAAPGGATYQSLFDAWMAMAAGRAAHPPHARPAGAPHTPPPPDIRAAP